MNKYDELIESCRACASGFNTNCDRCMFCRKDNLEKFCYEQLHDAAADAIEELSKERKTGKWVKISPAGIRECSLCHHSILTSDIDVYKFCFSCGAKMIGGDDDV